MDDTKYRDMKLMISCHLSFSFLRFSSAQAMVSQSFSFLYLVALSLESSKGVDKNDLHFKTRAQPYYSIFGCVLAIGNNIDRSFYY